MGHKQFEYIFGDLLMLGFLRHSPMRIFLLVNIIVINLLLFFKFGD